MYLKIIYFVYKYLFLYCFFLFLRIKIRCKKEKRESFKKREMEKCEILSGVIGGSLGYVIFIIVLMWLY